MTIPACGLSSGSEDSDSSSVAVWLILSNCMFEKVAASVFANSPLLYFRSNVSFLL